LVFDILILFFHPVNEVFQAGGDFGIEIADEVFSGF
jgi:hypothetical protein